MPTEQVSEDREPILQCPKCGASKIAYSRLQQFDDLKMSFIAKRPHRCLECYKRFWAREKFTANSKRIWTLAIIALLVAVVLLRAFGVLSRSEQTAQVSLVVPEHERHESEQPGSEQLGSKRVESDEVSSQSKPAPALASQISMPQGAGEKAISDSAQASSNANREFTQATVESLNPEQRARQLLLAKQQAEAAAQISQARVEQLEQVLLPADDELKSLVKIEVSYMVERWREAWSSGDLDEYLLNYSSNFKPENDLSLTQWQAERQSRVTPEKDIVIELNDFEVIMLEQLSSVVVEFNQHYQTGSYVEDSRKRLSLAKEQGAWKIMAEVELP